MVLLDLGFVLGLGLLFFMGGELEFRKKGELLLCVHTAPFCGQEIKYIIL
jgi:hypothetical protein